jgi:hypothetical protein
VTGYHEAPEQKLMPLVITHAIVDFWTIGWFLFPR